MVKTLSPGTRVVKFNSQSKGGSIVASNLHFTSKPLSYKGHLYDSTECAYQERFLRPSGIFKKDKGCFGDLPLSQRYAVVFGSEDEGAKKQKFWGKKKCHGVLSKMVRNCFRRIRDKTLKGEKPPKRDMELADRFQRSIGLDKVEHITQNEDAKRSNADYITTWKDILCSKASSSEEFRHWLMSTGNSVLMEFDKSAKRTETETQTECAWGGMLSIQGDGHGESIKWDSCDQFVVPENTQVCMWGFNIMGEHMMRIRDALCTDKSPPLSTLIK